MSLAPIMITYLYGSGAVSKAHEQHPTAHLGSVVFVQ